MFAKNLFVMKTIILLSLVIQLCMSCSQKVTVTNESDFAKALVDKFGQPEHIDSFNLKDISPEMNAPGFRYKYKMANDGDKLPYKIHNQINTIFGCKENYTRDENPYVYQATWEPYDLDFKTELLASREKKETFYTVEISFWSMKAK